METYNGHVRTPTDAIILFEACRIGLLPRVQRRLSEKERHSIKSGSVFVWDEREAGMRRWTDGKSWSASRVSGSFLTYREMEGKRGGGNLDKAANRDGVQGNEGDSDGGPDGYRYKPDGLSKQSFSITTTNGQHLHLISYISKSQANGQDLSQPSTDPQLRHIRPEKGMYPESTVSEQSAIPAVTRGPMSSPGYTHSPHQPSPYHRAAPYPWAPQPGWAPPSPMHTPPPHSHYSPYYHMQNPQYAAHPSLHAMQYPPHPPQQPYGPHPPMTAFDRPPLPLATNGVPPPPPHQYVNPPPHPANGYPSGYPYQHGYPPYQAPPYPPAPVQHPQPYEHRPRPPPPSALTEGLRQEVSKPKEDRQDSHRLYQQVPPRSQPLEHEEQAKPGAAPQNASSGQTIPSILAMLNAGDNDQPPQRTSSRSPGGTSPGPLQDIPSHKLGFEANRDVQALRNLDKSTFKY